MLAELHYKPKLPKKYFKLSLIVGGSGDFFYVHTAELIAGIWLLRTGTMSSRSHSTEHLYASSTDDVISLCSSLRPVLLFRCEQN